MTCRVRLHTAERVKKSRAQSGVIESSVSSGSCIHEAMRREV